MNWKCEFCGKDNDPFKCQFGEESDLLERAAKAIDNLKGMSGSMARVQYDNGKGHARLIEELVAASRNKT